MSAPPADPGCVLEHAPQSEPPRFEPSQFEPQQFEPQQFEPEFGLQSPQRAAARPDTPCVAVCSTTFDDVCRGCGRTVAEVAHWVAMTSDQKEAVWVRILAQGYPRRNT